MAQLSSFCDKGTRVMFIDYTPQEVKKLQLALNTKKEISLNKTVSKKIINLKYHDLDDSTKQLAQIITKIKFFKGLDERKLLDIIKTPSLNRYSRGDIILNKSTNTKTLFYIISGSIKLIYIDKDGNINNYTHKAGEIFNEIASITSVNENRVVYANDDNTKIFGFILNDSLSKSSDYSPLYSTIYKNISLSIAKKFLAYSIK